MIKQTTSVQEILKLVKTKKSDYWETVRKEKTLELFHEAAKGVPAYQEFLNKNKIVHESINSIGDFQKVPAVDKENYLKKYPFEKLFWNGNLNKPLVYTSTSGSTGEPYYFARGELLDWQYSVIIEQFLKLNENDFIKPTLVIVCFGMGVWIGGLITYKAYEMVANRNDSPISIITPGISKNDIFNSLKNLAPKYEQVILVGYAPFIKDIIDEASDREVDLKKINLKIQFAAEAITENLRDYLVQEAGVKNIYTDFMNIYGSADIGAMAFESSTSILIRRLAMKNKDLFYDIFTPINKTPTLAQFIPSFINFESIDGRILLSGHSELPLIRYSIGDNGGVFSFDEVKEKLSSHGIDIYEEARKLGLENKITELPFVFVYERANLSISFYGLNLYPEWLKDAFLKRDVSDLITGKFTMMINFDDNENQELEIIIEKKRKISLTPEKENLVFDKIIATLKTNSSEYRELLDKLGNKAYPKLKFVESGDSIYFPSGIKQKWVKK